jgi:hypothetical protein
MYLWSYQLSFDTIMDDTTETIVSNLKTSKQQGLTYYQATLKLKEQGFTDDQINLAGSSFPYTGVASASIDNNQLSGPTSLTQAENKDMSSAEILGETLLKDQQKTIFNSKFFIYSVLFLSGFSFAWELMRLYLVPHWFSSSGPNIFTHSSSYNYSVTVRYKYTYPAEGGVIGGITVVVVYVLYKLLTNRSED